jgi:hypothetical protein
VQASPHRRLVLPGSAFRLATSDLHWAIGELASLRKLLLSYLWLVRLQSSQAAACDLGHTLRQRLARWLLIASDRSGRNALPMTHYLLSRMLGVRRAGVSEALKSLEQEGLVTNARGCVSLLDRDGLERVSCPCYRIIRREQERLLPEPRTAVSLSPQVGDDSIAVLRTMALTVAGLQTLVEC